MALASPLILSLLCSFAAPAPQSGRDKELAPPPLTVDGITGVPIDVLDLEATLRFDAEARTAFATATMSFETTGEGFPLFDLRQKEIVKARLDGEPVDPAKLASHAVSRQCGSMRILEAALPAGTRHELKLEYPVGTPDAPQAQGVLWRDGGGVLWDTWFSDLNQGRYLESWFPANLLHDQHPMTLTLDLVNAGSPHHLITNGVVEARGEHAWTLEFPPTFTSCSHLIVLVPAAEVTVGGVANGFEPALLHAPRSRGADRRPTRHYPAGPRMACQAGRGFRPPCRRVRCCHGRRELRAERHPAAK